MIPATLHVERYGVGPTAIFSHGFGGSARNFRPQARAFSEHHSSILFDARGHARSEAPSAREAYSLPHFVEDLVQLIPQQQPTVLVGLSMGAAITLTTALKYPDRVSGLVIAAVPPGIKDETQRAWALGFADSIEQEGLEKAGERWVWGEKSRFDAAAANKIRQGLLEHPPHALAHILRGLLAVLPPWQNVASELKRLQIPTLIVVGSEDHAALASSQELAGLIPNARFEVIPDAGHVVNLAAPQIFNQLLNQLWAEVQLRAEPAT